MLKISDILYKSDHEYKVDISVKRRSVVAFGALAFALVTIFSADLVYSNIDINQSRKIYSIEDYEMEQTEYERICENIVSYGVPKKWVSLMPKSEISEYKNAVNKSEMTESAQQLMDYYEENGFSNNVFNLTFIESSLPVDGEICHNTFSFILRTDKSINEVSIQNLTVE